MATRAEIEAYIRQAATARGLDPNFAVKVATGESGLNPAARLNTAKEDSKGIWQLNTKNGLGVEALRRGIDPGNPETWREQTDFALDQARKSWRPWTVARNLQAGRVTPTGASAASQVAQRPSAAAPGPTSPLPNVSAPDRGILSPAVDPFKAIADAAKERQEKQMAQLAASVAPQAPAPVVQAPAPVAPPPAVDYAALLLPRIKRGLLADDYSIGLLGAA